METAAIPVTERSNALSSALDVSTPKQIVDILSAVDEELFRGYKCAHQSASFPDSANFSSEDFPSLTSSQIDTCIQKFVQLVFNVLLRNHRTHESGKYDAIVLSGCGTSGR